MKHYFSFMQKEYYSADTLKLNTVQHCNISLCRVSRRLVDSWQLWLAFILSYLGRLDEASSREEQRKSREEMLRSAQVRSVLVSSPVSSPHLSITSGCRPTGWAVNRGRCRRRGRGRRRTTQEKSASNFPDRSVRGADQSLHFDQLSRCDRRGYKPHKTFFIYFYFNI